VRVLDGRVRLSAYLRRTIPAQQRLSAPWRATRAKVGASVREAFAHVVEKAIGMGMDRLADQSSYGCGPNAKDIGGTRPKKATSRSGEQFIEAVTLSRRHYPVFFLRVRCQSPTNAPSAPHS